MTMTTNKTDVPHELLRHIFECLPEDKHTLSSCGLVCKAWEPAARPVLFREVTLYPDVVGATAHPQYPELEIPDWKSAARAFSQMTHLASYVQVLHIEGGHLPMEKEMLDEYGEVEIERGEDGTETATRLNYCSIDLASLYAIVKALPNLRKVAFNTLAVKIVPVPALEPVCIDVLEMHDAGTAKGENPFDILNILRPKKVDLDIFHRPGSDGAWPEAHMLPDSATTDNWKVRGDPSAAPLIRGLAASSHGRITSLSVDLKNEKDLVALAESLAVFGPALKELRLDLWDATWVATPHVFLAPAFEEVWCDAFSLAECKGLRSIEINVKIGFGEDSMALLASVARVCSTLPPTICSVHLILDLAYFDPEGIDDMPWLMIGLALSSKTKHPDLEKVTLTVFDGDGDMEEEDQDNMRQAIVSQLPDLEECLHIAFAQE